jgi:hypothetical protein
MTAQAYLNRALALSRMSIRDPSYIRTWNALEDEVLALSKSEKRNLYSACMDWPNDGAMILFTILPDHDDLTGA